MKRAILLPALLVGLLAIRTNAGEAKSKVHPEPQPPSQDKQDEPAAEGPASDQSLPEPTEPVIPKRELVFEESDRKYPVRLFATDPSLLEQRYVAVFRILANERGPRSSGQVGSLYQQLTLGDSARWLAKLLEQMPKKRAPSKEVVSILVKDARRHIIQRRLEEYEAPEGLCVVEFNVLGPTPELVRELVAGMIQFYDYGLSYPIQEECLEVVIKYQSDLPKARAELDEIDEQLAEQEGRLKAYQDYEDITPQSLIDLMTQRRLLLVELAGAQARIEACDKLLARGLSPAGTERVETIKISAEIELVGLEARKDYIDHVVEKGREHQAIWTEVQAARKELARAKARLSKLEEYVKAYRSERKRFEPFAIEGEKITIHPIEWKSPQDDQERWWEQ